MFPTLMVTFREGVEAFLIVAVTLSYLRQTGRDHLVPALRAGTAVAVLLSAAFGIVLARVGSLRPVHEGWLATAAFVLVLSCTVHMLRHGKRIAADMRRRMDAASRQGPAGSRVAVFLFVLLMIGREGVETATMLASLASSSTVPHLFVGGSIGVVLAGALAWAWARHGRRVDLTRFFQVTAIFMVLFSVQLLIYAFHEFSEAGALPWIDNARWHVLSEPFGPEGPYGAWLSYSLFLAPVVYLLRGWWRDHGERRAPRPRAVTASEPAARVAP